MFIIRILNFFKGYVSFTVEGFFIERFLNITTHRNIYLWNIKKLGTQKTKMCISLKGFSLLSEIAEKTNVEIKKLKETGIPFIFQKYRKRTAFLIGGTFFFIFIFVMSFFLWAVDIEYVGDIPREQIIAELEAAGLKLGRPTALINQEEIKAKMMNNFEEFAWVGLNLTGTCAYVHIEERQKIPEVEDITIPCNIVATKPGVIEQINTKLGMQQVIIGTAVVEGQLLVSGVVDSAVLGVRFLHAISDIKARTWITKQVPTPRFKEEITRTKKTKSKHFLNLFGLKIPLFFSDKVGFAEFERVSEIKQAKLGNKLFLPIFLHYDKFYEVKKENRPLSEQEALEIAKNSLIEQAKPEFSQGGEVLNETFETSTSEAGETVITLTWECLENIGRKESILIEN